MSRQTRKVIQAATEAADAVARNNDTTTGQTAFRVHLDSAYACIPLYPMILCAIVTIITVIAKQPHSVSILFGALGAVCLVLFLFLKTWHYRVDEHGVTDYYGLLRGCTVAWDDVTRAHRYKHPHDRTVSVLFYDRKRLRFECSSLMIGYNDLLNAMRSHNIPVTNIDTYPWGDWIRRAKGRD